jgi:hypothetical protein
VVKDILWEVDTVAMEHDREEQLVEVIGQLEHVEVI